MKSTNRLALPLVAVALLAACSEPASGPAAIRPNFVIEPPPLGVTLCKKGSAASFTVTHHNVATNVNLADGECRLVADNDIGVGGSPFNVTITEIVPDLFMLDSITKDTVSNFEDGATHSVITGTTTVTAELNDETSAFTITYFNSPVPPPPPAGGQGCTPGYWKQRQHYGSWPAPYFPTTQFSAVFENAFPGMTLVQVLGLGGGGLNALGRHTVAALLNSGSADVSYDIAAPSDVINAFNALFPQSNKNNYGPLHMQFANFNEQGCPLGRADN